MNQVSIIGRIAQEPVFGNSGRLRTVTLGVQTEDEGGDRIHQVTIMDEFLAKAMHDRLVVGATVHVLGELDYDDNGCFVAVTQRRGSDVHVLGVAEDGFVQASPASSPQRPAVATSAPAAPPVHPQRPVVPVAAPRPVSTPPQPESPPAAAPAAETGDLASGAEAARTVAPQAQQAPVVAPPPRRPFPPASPAFPVPRVVPPSAPKPVATASGGVLGGLKSSGPPAATDEPPFPGDVPSKSGGGLGGLRPPPPSGGARAPTGPDRFDDDIPF